ncbi:MAG: hypothetical protein ACI4AQ_08080 [Lachnospiraceae bacterium]
MICEKCGIEFHEGRECPNCGTLAIFVKDDEYQNRRQEWEDENAPKEETEEVKKKKKIQIQIDYAKVKKVLVAVVLVAVVFGVVMGTVKMIRNFLAQERYTLVYDNGTVLDTGEGKFEVYPSENAIYTTDGNYVYVNKMNTNGVDGDVSRKAVSKSGEYCAVISMLGDDIDAMTYFLYRVENRDDVKGSDAILVTSGSNELDVVEVNDNGDIYYVESAVGAYSAIESMTLYCFDGEKRRLIAEDIARITPCENEDEFIYYDREMLGYLYSKGKSVAIESSNDGTGNEYVHTSEGTTYYLTKGGELYQVGKVGSIDRGIISGTLNSVANSDKVTYVRDGALYCIGGDWKEPVQLIPEYDMYGTQTAVLERHGVIYYVDDGVLCSCKASGKKKEVKQGVEAVYFMLD